uniref:Venom peptide Ht216 n=1 Tax=Hadogenes troglodytes TaxID=1577150 RepID=A0A1B3IJ90_9SCOR|nr:venom peptide Ht216 [Hadogenes troglodytes]
MKVLPVIFLALIVLITIPSEKTVLFHSTGPNSPTLYFVIWP